MNQGKKKQEQNQEQAECPHCKVSKNTLRRLKEAGKKKKDRKEN